MMSKRFLIASMLCLFAVSSGSYAVTNGTIGDFVWSDLNRDGAQDRSENGLCGVRFAVRL